VFIPFHRGRIRLIPLAPGDIVCAASISGKDRSLDRSRRFGGIARLYGPAALDRLAAARVCVVGVGGVGSWAVEALARSGVGCLTLVDMDHIAESNVNRQIHALEPDFGKAKVRALAQRIAAINPEARVQTLETFAEPGNLEGLIDPDQDFLLDCIDGFRSKAALIAHCRCIRLRLVSVGGAGGMVDPARVRVADLNRAEQDPLLSKTRKLLRSDYGFPRNPKRWFEVPCVYSDEQRIPPTGVGACGSGSPAAAGGALSCGGYGSSVAVTATFGFVAAARVLTRLAMETKAGDGGAMAPAESGVADQG
jgi:tRNA A37 threonylcarbamoyladenosine dehydratase